MLIWPIRGGVILPPRPEGPFPSPTALRAARDTGEPGKAKPAKRILSSTEETAACTRYPGIRGLEEDAGEYKIDRKVREETGIGHAPGIGFDVPINARRESTPPTGGPGGILFVDGP